MDFGLSEEQQLLQQTVRRFVENECPPTRLREIFDGEEGHDPALWGGLMEMGLGGLIVPEAYGGAALELLMRSSAGTSHANVQSLNFSLAFDTLFFLFSSWPFIASLKSASIWAHRLMPSF